MVDFPIAFPSEDIGFQESSIRLEFNQAYFEGDLTRKASVQRHAGGTTDHWAGFWTTTALTPAQTAIINAWVISLKGRLGTFKAYDPDQRTPFTFIAAGLTIDSTIITIDSTTKDLSIDAFPENAVVNGADQRGNTLAVTFESVSVLVLRAGDWFSLQDTGQAFKLTADANTNGSGNVTLEFQPRIRIVPSNGSVALTTFTFFLARLNKADFLWESDNVKTSPMTLGFREDF